MRFIVVLVLFLAMLSSTSAQYTRTAAESVHDFVVRALPAKTVLQCAAREGILTENRTMLVAVYDSLRNATTATASCIFLSESSEQFVYKRHQLEFPLIDGDLEFHSIKHVFFANFNAAVNSTPEQKIVMTGFVGPYAWGGDNSGGKGARAYFVQMATVVFAWNGKTFTADEILTQQLNTEPVMVDARNPSSWLTAEAVQKKLQALAKK